MAAPPKGRAAGKPAAPVYATDIAPLLEKNCAGCHNAQAATSGYDMSSTEKIVAGGNKGAAITPGNAKTSLLYRYLIGAQQPVMPLGGKLTSAQINTVKRWIDSGAKFAALRAAPAAPKIVAYGTTRDSVAPPVTALAFSPDGKTLAVGSYREVQEWDMNTGKKRRTLIGPSEGVYALCFAPNGKTLAAGGGVPTIMGEVLLFDPKSGQIKNVLHEHSDVVYGLDYTPDGKRLVTASGDKTLRLWDAATGKSLKVMKDHADSVYGVRVTPDGTRILSTGVDRSIKVWDSLTGKPLFTFTGRAHNDTAYTLDFAPDGKHLLSSGGDNQAKMWLLGANADDTREYRTLPLHSRAVFAAAYSKDGMYIATASADKTVNVWSGVGGGFMRTLKGATDWVYAVRFTPDSRKIVAGTYDGKLLLWNAATGILEKIFSTRPALALMANAQSDPPEKKDEIKYYAPVKMVDGIAFPEGPAYNGKGVLFASGCHSDVVYKINKEGKAEQFKASKDKFTFEKTNGMTFFEDGSLFACDQGRKAIVQIFMDGRMELYADKPDEGGALVNPNDLAFDPDGNLYFTDPGNFDPKNPVGEIYRIARGTRKMTKVLSGRPAPNGIALSADGKTLYWGESQEFRVMRATIKPDGGLDAPELFYQMAKDNTPDGIAFDQSGNLYIANYEPGKVTVIDKNAKFVRDIPLPGDACTNVEFGGKEMKTLYITLANDKKPQPGGEVYQCNVEIGGLPLFRSPNNEVK